MPLVKASQGPQEVRAETGEATCLPAHFTVAGTGNQEGFTEEMLSLGFGARQRVYSGLARWLSSKEPASQRRKCGFHPGVGKIPWRRKWRQYSCLGSPMDRGSWQATVHGVTKSWTRLKD